MEIIGATSEYLCHHRARIIGPSALRKSIALGNLAIEIESSHDPRADIIGHSTLSKPSYHEEKSTVNVSITDLEMNLMVLMI